MPEVVVAEFSWEMPVITLPKKAGKLMLLTPGPNDKSRPCSNIMRTDMDNNFKWQAELPDPKKDQHDSYVSMKYSRGKLTANSWSGWLVELNLNDGSIVNKKFTK